MEPAVKDIHYELIEGCRLNSRDAQLKLYDLYYKAMYNVSYRIIGNMTEAEDIMQDSFLEAFTKIDTFRGEGSFGAWLKKIVVNRSINSIRKKKELLRLDDVEFEPEDVNENEASWSENIFCRLEEIRDAISLLPENYRIILSLHLLEGYDHEEISEILSTTYGNIRTRYSRAKQKLLEIIMKSRN